MNDFENKGLGDLIIDLLKTPVALEGARRTAIEKETALRRYSDKAGDGLMSYIKERDVLLKALVSEAEKARQGYEEQKKHAGRLVEEINRREANYLESCP